MEDFHEGHRYLEAQNGRRTIPDIITAINYHAAALIEV
jgi:hypothetical protein